jgi:hypothetical protein
MREIVSSPGKAGVWIEEIVDALLDMRSGSCKRPVDLHSHGDFLVHQRTLVGVASA